MSYQSKIPMPENEISLKEAIAFLISSSKTVILTSLFGVLVSLTYLAVTPNQYLAVANFEVAKVANIDIESPNILAQKFKIPTFYSVKSHLACNVINDDNPGEIISKKLRVDLPKISPIVNISYKASSSEDAKKCLESILDDVQGNQNLLAIPMLQLKKNQLQNLKQKVEAAERFIRIFSNKDLNFDFSDSKFSASALLFTLIADREKEMITLRNQINDLEISLTEPLSRGVFLVAPIYTSKEKVSPNGLIVTIYGLVVGGVLGILLRIGIRRLYFHKVVNLNS